MSGPQRAPKRKMPSQRSGGATATKTAKPARAKRVVEAPKPKRKFPVLGIAFGVIALLLVAAITLGGNVGPGSEAGEPVLDGEPLAVYAQGLPDLAIGESAPVVSGTDYDGNTVAIGADGTPTAIVFLAHWCQFCQAEVPAVQAWLDSGGGVPGVEILSVATSINSARENYPPSDWLEREGWTAPVLRDDTDSSVHEAFGGGGFPYWVFLNGDGTVAARTSGRLEIGTLQALMQEIAQ